MIKATLSILLDKKVLIKILLVFAIAYFYLNKALDNNEKAPYVTGDGFEYIFITEAFVSHGTPDIRYNDIVDFKKKYSKSYKWDEFYKKGVVDYLGEFVRNSKKGFMDNNGSFFFNRHKKCYSYHFFFYSLINVPAYFFLKSKGPVVPFWVTNALLIILTVIIIVCYSPFSFNLQLLFALCFSFSSCFWYLKWEHAEVLASSLVTIGMIFYFRKDWYLSLIFLGLACLQTQPLILLLGFVGISAILEKGINLRNILIVSAISLIAFIPQLFYYVNFNTTNLVKDAGFLNPKFITANRINGFFFDLNTGIILAIPLILLFYFPLLLHQLINMIRKKEKFEITILLPFCILSIVIVVCMMINWNHSMAIVNRYATWTSSIIMAHVFYLTNRLSNLRTTVLSNYFLMLQVISVFYHQRINKFDWSNHRHSPFAYWVLCNYPEWYNPDPLIFGERTLHTYFGEGSSPVILFKEKKVLKILVHKNQLEDLKNFGFSQEKIDLIKNNVTFNFGWGYVGPEYKRDKTDEEVYNIIRERKVQKTLGEISVSPPWIKQMEAQAKEWNKPYEEVLRINAEYLITQDEKEQDREEKE